MVEALVDRSLVVVSASGLMADQQNAGAMSAVAEGELYDELHPEIKPFLDILRPLIRQPSVVGSEDSFFRVLERELEEFGVSFQRYHGVLVAQGNQPESLFLSAHIDRHGLLCTGANEFQYAAFIAGAGTYALCRHLFGSGRNLAVVYLP